jgi:hypothetical protein
MGRGEKSCGGGVRRLGKFYYLALGWWREGGGGGVGDGGEEIVGVEKGGGGVGRKGRSSVLIRFGGRGMGRGMLSQYILSFKLKYHYLNFPPNSLLKLMLDPPCLFDFQKFR